MMTKKHFKKFANAIANISNDKERLLIKMAIVEVLADDNPRFDYNKFTEWIRRVRAGESLKGIR